MSGTARTENETNRLRAIDMIREGRSQSEVAKQLSVSRQTIWRWLRKYRQGGPEALLDKQPTRTGRGRLVASEVYDLFGTLVDHEPQHMGLYGRLWTYERITSFIEQHHGIRITVQTIRKYFGQWGIRFHRPAQISSQHELARTRHWLRTEYPVIRRAAESEGIPIFWLARIPFSYSVPQRKRTAQKAILLPQSPNRLLYAARPRNNMDFFHISSGTGSANAIRFLERLVEETREKRLCLIFGYGDFYSREVLEHVIANHPSFSAHALPDGLVY